jgi:ketosteroid isomerase-like protein
MSEENVESLRAGVEAFDRQDKATWLSTFDNDAVMIPAREWPENAPIRGAEAIWDFYLEVTANWEGGRSELGEIIEVREDTFVVNTRRETRGKASGAGFAFDYWFVMRFRRGKATRVEWFSDRGAALEAAGRSE